MAEITFNMYQSASLLSLAVADRSEVFACGNPSKENEFLKGHCDLAVHEWNQLQEKLASIDKEIKIDDIIYELS